MNKLVITTQYMENYGDKENPYMKFKGGTTYVMYNVGDLTENEIATHVAKVRPFITTDFEQSNGGSEEYVNTFAVVNHNEKICDEWETITQFSFAGSTVNFMKVTDNRNDGWMREEILEKTETWVGDMSHGTKRGAYYDEYLMEDGDMVHGQNGLKEWFVTAKMA